MTTFNKDSHTFQLASKNVSITSKSGYDIVSLQKVHNKYNSNDLAKITCLPVAGLIQSDSVLKIDSVINECEENRRYTTGLLHIIRNKIKHCGYTQILYFEQLNLSFKLAKNAHKVEVMNNNKPDKGTYLIMQEYKENIHSFAGIVWRFLLGQINAEKYSCKVMQTKDILKVESKRDLVELKENIQKNMYRSLGNGTQFNFTDQASCITFKKQKHLNYITCFRENAEVVYYLYKAGIIVYPEDFIKAVLKFLAGRSEAEKKNQPFRMTVEERKNFKRKTI